MMMRDDHAASGRMGEVRMRHRPRSQDAAIVLQSLVIVRISLRLCPPCRPAHDAMAAGRYVVLQSRPSQAPTGG